MRRVPYFCKNVLPFKLDDGNYYFEKIEFLEDLKKSYYQNYLALCPNHSAMFQHVSGSRDLLKRLFIEMEDQHLKVSLAQADATLYFTKTHVQTSGSLLTWRGPERAGRAISTSFPDSAP
jgi:hypothetical protein